MRIYLLTLLALILCALGAQTEAAPVKPAEDSPIPYLSWQDVKALYAPKKYPGDWDCLKVKEYPHQEELIERCKRDLRISMEANPDPLHRNHALPEGKLSLFSINKDPDNRIVYFVFSYESELVTDLFVVYYYDPYQGRFILKSTR